MNCVSCDICVYHLGLCVFFPWGILSSRVTGACPVTTDLIMRVNVRTTTTLNGHSSSGHTLPMPALRWPLLSPAAAVVCVLPTV